MSQQSNDINEISIKNWNESYIIDDSKNLWGDPAVPYVNNAVPVFLENKGPVLDIPCGDARNTIEFAKASFFVFGADSSPNALALAKKALEQTGQNTHCILLESDVFKTKFSSDQFSNIFCWDLLGHLQTPVPALQELLRICKPGGKIVASIFSTGDSTRGDDMEKIQKETEEYLYQNKFYFRYYNETEVNSLLSKLDAKIENLELTRWTEPPHEGYREYEHEHESWAFTIKKL